MRWPSAASRCCSSLADAVQHLELVLVGLAPGAAGQLLRDGDHARVVRPDHRVALARHQDLQAAHVRLVDLGLAPGRRPSAGSLYAPFTSRTRRALARRGGGRRPRCGRGRTGARAGLREVLPQLGEDGERRVDGGVVLHVERDRRARSRRRPRRPGGRWRARGRVRRAAPGRRPTASRTSRPARPGPAPASASSSAR